jgi:hypothetical protein
MLHVFVEEPVVFVEVLVVFVEELVVLHLLVLHNQGKILLQLEFLHHNYYI